MPIISGGNPIPGPSGVYHEEVSFTEAGGALTYTGSVSVPAGAYLLEVIVHAVALWDNAGAVTMKVGDAADDDGIFTGVNLKATDLLAGESICIEAAGGKQGADLDDFAAPGAQMRRRYLSTARVISGIITAAGAGGSAGRTRMLVVYTLPGAAIAATSA